MEKFINLNDIFIHDLRSCYIGGTIDHQTGKRLPFPIETLHSALMNIQLTNSVPEEIQSSFNIAKNLALYSWFCYPFHQIAELKAFSTLEEALKLKLGKHKNGFKGQLKKAFNEGHLQGIIYTHIAPDNIGNSDELTKKLIETLPNHRNNLAHGSQTLHPFSKGTLIICSNIINKLYEDNLR